MNLVVDEDVHGAFGSEFGGGNGNHAGAATEAVDGEEDEGVAAGRDRQGSNAVEVYRDFGATGERNIVDGPANGLQKVFLRIWHLG